MKVNIYKKVITSANILTVEVGTNCPQGGDTGHCGRTYLKIKDEALTDIRIKVNGEWVDILEIELLFGGNCECETLIDALRYAVNVLELQSNNRQYKIDHTEEL